MSPETGCDLASTALSSRVPSWVGLTRCSQQTACPAARAESPLPGRRDEHSLAGSLQLHTAHPRPPRRSPPTDLGSPSPLLAARPALPAFLLASLRTGQGLLQGTNSARGAAEGWGRPPCSFRYSRSMEQRGPQAAPGRMHVGAPLGTWLLRAGRACETPQHCTWGSDSQYFLSLSPYTSRTASPPMPPPQPLLDTAQQPAGNREGKAPPHAVVPEKHPRVTKNRGSVGPPAQRART